MEELQDLYLNRDLEDYASTPASEPSGYGRTPYLKAILPDTASIDVYSTGGYQGTMGYLIELDGYLWIIKESYGSCALCDGFIDSDKVEYAKSMCRNAYCFDEKENAIEFLEYQADDSRWIWGKIADELIEMVQNT